MPYKNSPRAPHWVGPALLVIVAFLLPITCSLLPVVLKPRLWVTKVVRHRNVNWKSEFFLT